jgi:hypothetical protein
MSEVTDKSKEQSPGADDEPLCTCVPDPFTSLPPELRPKRAPKKNSLSQVTCPGCGKEYLTNRSTDRCFDCEIRS